MTISEMHILFKLSLDKVGNSSLPYFEPEAIDLILNYAIKAVYKQKISGNNALMQGAEETNKRRVDLQTMIVGHSTETFVTNSDNKPYSKFVEVPSNMFYLLDEEVCIFNKNCQKEILSGNIEEGAIYKVAQTVSGGNVLYGVNTYLDSKTFVGTTTKIYTATNAKVYEVSRVNVLPIRNDQYNTLTLDPFNRPDENKILKLDYGVISSKLYYELIGSKTIEILKYYLRYYKTPATVNYPAFILNPVNGNCDLPAIIHEEIVDFAVNWTLESIESPRFQSQIANLQRNE